MKVRAEVHHKDGGHAAGTITVDAICLQDAFDILYGRGLIASSMWYKQDGSWYWCGIDFCRSCLLDLPRND